MYTSTGFAIDITNTVNNPGYLYTEEGIISGVNVVGNIGPLMTAYDCNDLDGVVPVNFFVDAYSQKLTIDFIEILNSIFLLCET